jgi:enoyl-CoA hydratase/carnithine racemase
VSYQYAIYEKKGRIAYVTLNRPEVMNALHADANRELSAIWTDFRDDPEVWVAILTGAGDRAFSAGNDLKVTAAGGGTSTGGYPGPPIVGGFGGLTSRFDIFKPIIAAVNGYALGGGLELALACDIIVCAEHARLGLPEPRVGLMAGAGGVHRLPRHIPFKVAMGMILTGRHITAQEAYRLGLVNEVVPLSELMPTAERWANEILACAPLSVRASKQAALQGLGLPLEEAMSRRYELVTAMRESEDLKEGPRAFAEKRPPRWTGR